MRIQLVSDLHREFFPRGLREHADIVVDRRADVLVLAGDIDKGEASLLYARELAQRAGIPVVWVAGNHEYYLGDYAYLHERFSREQGEGVHALMGGSVLIDGVRFLGATLWTDFALYAQSVRMPGVAQAMAASLRGLNDWRAIRGFSPADSLAAHREERAFLERELQASGEFRATVVVSHHCPHPKSVHPRFAVSEEFLAGESELPPHHSGWWELNPSFASNLEPLVEKADLWLHGHTHESVSYHVGKCHVAANPRGTPGWMRSGDVVFENRHFEQGLLLSV